MKILVLKVSLAIALAFVSQHSAIAHGGRLDSNGGHNCRVGSCAGTYHCHKPLSTFCKDQLNVTKSKKQSKK